jgi:hypothetical protein
MAFLFSGQKPIYLWGGSITPFTFSDYGWKNLGVGVLDEPYSAKPAQRSSHTGSPGYIGRTRFQLPAYVDWRACTATPLSRIS